MKPNIGKKEKISLLFQLLQIIVVPIVVDDDDEIEADDNFTAVVFNKLLLLVFCGDDGEMLLENLLYFVKLHCCYEKYDQHICIAFYILK